MKFHDVEQNSDEWYDLRLGRFTASSIKSLLMAKSTKGYKSAIDKIAFEIAFNRIPEDAKISSLYMSRGHTLEPVAVQRYEDQTFAECTNGGFFTKEPCLGASPDRCIKDSLGGLEVKCPAFGTMIGYSINPESLQKEYYTQVQSQIMVCEFEWVDLCAYHPDFKLVIVRVEKDAVHLETLQREIDIAIPKVEELVKRLKDFVAPISEEEEL